MALQLFEANEYIGEQLHPVVYVYTFLLFYIDVLGNIGLADTSY